MHDISSESATQLAANLLVALKAFAKRGGADPADVMFEAPEVLQTLRNLGLGDGDLALGEQLAAAVRKSVGELPPADSSALESILGITPGTHGQRLGVRRSLAADTLGVTPGTFRNRHEARLLESVAQRLAAVLLSSAQVSTGRSREGARERPRSTSEKALGFWSYVQDDDAGDGGRVLDLSVDLRTQYKMQTAEDLELFVDRESAQWGEEWEKLISDAIAGTTFFIPIITPSYFRSNACRQELLKFVREADKAGLQRLLMPVYWITVPALENEGVDSIDEAVRAIAKHQWRDLRDIRLEDRPSSQYRKAVSDLAETIAKRASEVVNAVDDVQGGTPFNKPEDEADDEDLGLLDRLAAGDEAMEILTSVLEAIGKDIELIGDLAASAGENIQAAQARGQGMKRALAITEKLARDLEDPASRIERRGRAYAELLVRLNSGLEARFDLFEDQSEPLTDEQVQYLGELEDLATNADGALNSLEELVESVDPISTVSRSLRAPVRKMRGGIQGILDGRAVIAEWGKRAANLKEHDTEGN